MPTNTRSPSRTSREATATINSCGVHSVIADPQRVEVNLGEIRSPVPDVENPPLQPGLESIVRPCRRRVIAEEAMVSVEVALDGRRMRTAGLMDHGDDLRLRKQDPVRMLEQGRSL